MSDQASTPPTPPSAPVQVSTGNPGVPVDVALAAAVAAEATLAAAVAAELHPAPPPTAPPPPVTPAVAAPAPAPAAPALPAWLDAGVSKLSAAQRLELKPFIDVGVALDAILKKSGSVLEPVFSFDPIPKIKLVSNKVQAKVALLARRLGAGGYSIESQYYSFLSPGDLQGLKALIKQIPLPIRELGNTFQNPSGF